MASATRSRGKVTACSPNLSLETAASTCKPLNPKPKSKSKSKPEKIVDSWEDDDDDDDSGSDKESRTSAVSSPVALSSPSTPFAATHGSVPDWNHATDRPASPRGGDAAKRPEKTDAVARRMIAAGLGLKAPKQTEEQRAYQRSVREQEKKKREQEKEEEQRRRKESEMAKAAVWED
ncbi:hypothetical protein E4U22_007601 [Claviceps purpurea]|nr:hypothetical protein E4U11_003357 [Claviceps purpurea]KAG6173230.1 hypothetical protein E4U51_005889 [Claviceps purpurea]KAG6228674.1 hypothetical protein E4U34_004150 [Claviceps purpurea]KAG6277910.1 hypothetical protein E4U48_000836 [Claviceps purpurea]KAG6278697.1 hypothetical protein E4U47_005067 [Claviceps purpurea]